MPDNTTLCRRQKRLKVQVPYRTSSSPLHALVDSTGIKPLAEGERQVRSARRNRFTSLGRPEGRTPWKPSR